MESGKEKEVVLVTGFGPFRHHIINASWEAVKRLENYETPTFKIVVQQLTVSYQHVDENVPVLWERLKPKLVVHVGVSNLLSDRLQVETVAYRSGYYSKDVTDKCHDTGECCTLLETPPKLQTDINIKELCEKFRKDQNGIEICTSEDAGRYLCEYTFFKSLSIDTKRTLFVHVPELDKPYTVDQLADGILKIINIAFEMLNEEQLNSV